MYNPIYKIAAGGIAGIEECNQFDESGYGCGGETWVCPKFSTTVPQQGGCWFCFDLFAPDLDNVERLDFINGTIDGVNTPVGCGYGCFPCRDFPNEWTEYASHTDGTRFLLPYFPLNDQEPIYQNRDGRGYISDLHSNKPHLMPKIVYYRRGVTFEQGIDGVQPALECLDDACDDGYYIPNFITELGGQCENGEEFGATMQGRFPDCFAFHGSEIPRPDTSGTMFCRCVQSRKKSQVIVFEHQPYFQVQFHRSSVQANDSCTNVLAPLWSRIAGFRNCNNSFYWEVRKPGSPYLGQEYYYESPQKPRMDLLLIKPSVVPSLSFDGADLIDEQMTQEITIKNMVLKQVLTEDLLAGPQVFNFSQVERDENMVGLWTRRFNNDRTIPCEQLPVINFETSDYTLHGTMRNSNCPVQVELVVLQAYFDVHITTNKVITGRGLNEQKKVIPYFSILINIELGVRARFPKELVVVPVDKLKPKPGVPTRTARSVEIDKCKPPRLVQDWLPEDNPYREVFLQIKTTDDSCYEQKMPKVVSGFWDEELQDIVFDETLRQMDTIDYYVQNKVTGDITAIGDLPLTVDWKGQLNSFTFPSADTHAYDVPSTQSLESEMGLFLHGINNIVVPGWADFIDQFTRNPCLVYKGGVKFGIQPY